MARFVLDEPADYLTAITGGDTQAAPRFVLDEPMQGPQQQIQPQNPDGFFNEMGANFQHGIRSAQDLLSGNWEDIGRTVSTPQTEALGNKLFPSGSSGSLVDAVRNVGDTSTPDWSGALLEKFGNTPEGKALSVIGGVNPLYNAASTAINRYVNPVFTAPKEKGGYGFAPENVQLAEMLLGVGGLKKAGQISDPTLNLARKVNTAMGEGSGGQALPKAPPAAEVRAGASKTYAAADAAGGVWKPHLTDAWINAASKVLPQTNAGKTILGETPATQLVARMQNLRGQPLTLNGAQEIYSALGDMAAEHVDPKTGKLLAAGKKFSDIQDLLWDTMENASPADIVGGKAGFDLWKQGKSEWAKSIRMNDIERIISRAADADNPATVMKNGFRAMKDNPKRMYGLSKEERSAINHAARHGVLIGPLKFFGNRAISSLTGAMGGGPAGMAAGYVLGSLPRAAAGALQKGRAQKALNTVYRGPRQKTGLPSVNVRQIPSAAAGGVLGGILTPDQLNELARRFPMMEAQ